MWTRGSALKLYSKVSRYSTTGWTNDLPDLNIARRYHGCSFYTTDSGDNVGFTSVQVLLVTGGANGEILASTEIYRNEVWSVLPSAALPSPPWSLSAGKIDDTIFLMGKKVH